MFDVFGMKRTTGTSVASSTIYTFYGTLVVPHGSPSDQ